MSTEVDTIKRKLREAAVRALNRAAEDLKNDSLTEVPRGATEELARSVYVDEATFEETVDRFVAEVGYSAKYAGAQHEGHATQHWKTGKPERHWEVDNRPGGGKSGFLGDPLKALVPRFEKYFYEEWEKVLRG